MQMTIFTADCVGNGDCRGKGSCMRYIHQQLP